jgi:hypothetical protein
LITIRFSEEVKFPTEQATTSPAIVNNTAVSSPYDSNEILDVVDIQIDGYADDVAQNRKTNLNTALKKLKKTMSFHIPCTAIHPLWHHKSADVHCRLERHCHADTHQTDILCGKCYPCRTVHET